MYLFDTCYHTGSHKTCSVEGQGRHCAFGKTLYRLSLYLETCNIDLFLVILSGLFLLGPSVLWVLHYNLLNQE